MIYLLIYLVLGACSAFLMYLSAWGLNDVRLGLDRPWYENILSFIVMIFGCSFFACVIVAAIPIVLPFVVVGHLSAKRQKKLENQKLSADKAKFEAWKRLPR